MTTASFKRIFWRLSGSWNISSRCLQFAGDMSSFWRRKGSTSADKSSACLSTFHLLHHLILLKVKIDCPVLSTCKLGNVTVRKQAYPKAYKGIQNLKFKVRSHIVYSVWKQATMKDLHGRTSHLSRRLHLQKRNLVSLKWLPLNQNYSPLPSKISISEPVRPHWGHLRSTSIRIRR